eukprot:5675418-Prymnesium_polylepis.1
MRQFHAAHPHVALQVNVKRHPYSFLGDSVSQTGKRHKRETWHDGLLGYVGGDEAARARAEEGLRAQGRQAGIEFDFSCYTNWQPVDSQRLLLWAGRFGKQEPFMSAMNRRHFEQGARGESASSQETLLAAASEAGLDVGAVEAFLATDELVADVWRSYGDTVHNKGIHSIPYFVFSVPRLGLVGGPFRHGAGTPFVVNGSMDAPTFLKIFDAAHEMLLKAPPLAGQRVTISSLVSRADLNGLSGTAGAFSEASGRYAVCVEGTGEL